ncbi:uncharacterized protein [Oryza sativa Japonica Group]|uniref:cDNA clone:001-202-A08, full insert sequence n=2 Tax=Oryza sativa subsp. japonica TaxID=39947 RepID=B7EUW2_ORYSJ|nr:uncharacterized protein LOC9266840 [Oryza sativa Japonica Group]XP_015642448.1 uncharacterized protein LOC9266840 [Oryza sativa Japonica Group]XP_025881762.1 uncharacterized protein LOC9266840 [Oryza sativa Japonica Group]EEE66373.1 hypothetical protein OsJ_22691 [Oryza sativa Japonica Group]BAG96159.1 unnamed protein product [Oryza sativa Japonica Group]BAG97347.1 unnamed protein product [Oryza sativa Japonica Group]
MVAWIRRRRRRQGWIHRAPSFVRPRSRRSTASRVGSDGRGGSGDLRRLSAPADADPPPLPWIRRRRRREGLIRRPPSSLHPRSRRSARARRRVVCGLLLHVRRLAHHLQAASAVGSDVMGGSSSSLQSQLCLGVQEETGGGEGQNGGGGEGGGGGHIHQPNDEGAPVVQEHGHHRPGHDVAAGRRAGHRPRCRGARLQHTGLATEVWTATPWDSLSAR